MSNAVNKASLKKQINSAKMSGNLSKAAKLQTAYNRAVNAAEASSTPQEHATPNVSNRNIRQGEIDAAAIKAGINAAEASSTPQRQFLFHVIYDKDANDANKYTAENIVEKIKLDDIYSKIKNSSDSKKHFIIHVTYDADTKKYTPANMTDNAQGAGVIFNQINPNGNAMHRENSANLVSTDVTASNGSRSSNALPIDEMKTNPIDATPEPSAAAASSAAANDVAAAAAANDVAAAAAANDVAAAAANDVAAPKHGKLQANLENATRALKRAETNQHNTSGNATAKANALRKAQEKVKLAQNDLNAFNAKQRPKSAFSSSNFSMGGTRRRKQKKAKTQRKRR